MVSPTKSQLVHRALRRRCPYCGAKDLFSSWLKMRRHCPTCGLATDRVVGHWIGAVGVNTMVTFGLMFAVLFGFLIGTYPDIPLVPLLPATIAIAVVFPLLFWPCSQTLWTAIDIMLRPVTPPELDPRYLGR